MEVLPSLARKTDEKFSVVFNSVERALNPDRLAHLTESRISAWQAKLRQDGLTETTIKGYSAHLKAALRWAERMGLLVKAPKIDMPKRAKGSKVMKGRPITGEEFERMLAKVADAAIGQPKEGQEGPTPERAERNRAIIDSWKHYLRGLWLSGLRLSESLELWWDRDDRLCVDLLGTHPMLRIPAECEKGNQDRVLPMAPEFAEFLLATPEGERTGRVFKPMARAVRGERLCHFQVSRIVVRIGKAAGVKVATDPRSGTVKFASAHDLRRSFGERWSARIMPTDLMALMRHESIETTLRYYVGRNAQNTAKTLWEAHKKAVSGNTLGNSRQITPEATTEGHNVNPCTVEG
jgi:integrase